MQSGGLNFAEKLPRPYRPGKVSIIQVPASQMQSTRSVIDGARKAAVVADKLRSRFRRTNAVHLFKTRQNIILHEITVISSSCA